jgi:hypothetical protein
MADRVIVFLDYQNVYMGAREAFCPWGSPNTSAACHGSTSRGSKDRGSVEA